MFPNYASNMYTVFSGMKRRIGASGQVLIFGGQRQRAAGLCGDAVNNRDVLASSMRIWNWRQKAWSLSQLMAPHVREAMGQAGLFS